MNEKTLEDLETVIYSVFPVARRLYVQCQIAKLKNAFFHLWSGFTYDMIATKTRRTATTMYRGLSDLFDKQTRLLRVMAESALLTLLLALYPHVRLIL